MTTARSRAGSAVMAKSTLMPRFSPSTPLPKVSMRSAPLVFVCRCFGKDHQRSIIGSWSSLSERAEGIFGQGTIDRNVPQGAQAWSLIAKGHLSGLSIGFAAPIRRGSTITRAKLVEASLSIPAAGRARAKIKLKDLGTVPEVVDALAEGRVARRDLEYLVRKSWPGAPPTNPPTIFRIAASRESGATRHPEKER